MNKFTQEQEVLPDHLDDLKHVNNIQYLNWIQEISKKHWNKLITKKKKIVEFLEKESMVTTIKKILQLMQKIQAH